MSIQVSNLIDLIQPRVWFKCFYKYIECVFTLSFPGAGPLRPKGIPTWPFCTYFWRVLFEIFTLCSLLYISVISPALIPFFSDALGSNDKLLKQRFQPVFVLDSIKISVVAHRCYYWPWPCPCACVMNQEYSQIDPTQLFPQPQWLQGVHHGSLTYKFVSCSEHNLTHCIM